MIFLKSYLIEVMEVGCSEELVLYISVYIDDGKSDNMEDERPFALMNVFIYLFIYICIFQKTLTSSQGTNMCKNIYKLEIKTKRSQKQKKRRNQKRVS